MQTLAKAAAFQLHQPAEIRKPQFPSEEEKAGYRELDSIRASILDDDWPKKIAAFRKLYSLSRFNASALGHIGAGRMLLQRRLLQEEFDETMQAIDANDLPEIVDGVLDWIVVGLGFLQELGLTPTQINLCMEEVHASNLTKTDDQGKPIYDAEGKVLKGDNYVKADIAGLLRSFGWQA